MTRTQIRRALEQARRTGVVPMVPEDDMPMLRREARKMGLRLEAEAFKRSDNDCLRAAISYAYNVPYADTPDLDPLKARPPGPGRKGVQELAWRRWATERGLKWWSSDELAPVGVSRWIASVPSKYAGCTHAVVMEADHLLYDPAGTWTEVRQSDVRQARMLLPVDSPIWQAEIQYWPINGGTDDADAQ